MHLAAGNKKIRMQRIEMETVAVLAVKPKTHKLRIKS